MEKFRKMIQEIAKRQVPVQTRWVEVVSVDKDAASLTAKSPETDLEYYDVQIGVTEKRVPKAGSRALIGIVENKPAATFLIMAQELDEVELSAELIKLNGKDYTLLKGSETITEIKKLDAQVQAIIQVIKASPGIPEPGNGAPSALQAALKVAVTPLQAADYGNVENDTVKHGG